jgi:GTP 3',8-cyclase
VRFIELMPVMNQQPGARASPRQRRRFCPFAEIKRAGAARFDAGRPPEQRRSGDGPAREYQLAGRRAEFGFISPLSEHFCEQCNRMRLTADGSFRPCLLQDIEIPFLAALRAGEPVLPIPAAAVDQQTRRGTSWPAAPAHPALHDANRRLKS